MNFFFIVHQDIKKKQMTSIIKTSEFNVSNIQFSKAQENNIPQSKMTFKRIQLRYENNNDLQDLILESPPNLLSWGLQENRDMQTNNLNGYQMAMNLYTRNNVTNEERKFVDCIEAISDHVKQHLVENRDEIERYDLELADLKRLSPLYWKLDKGQKMLDKGPTLYVKCLYDKRDDQINTVFIDEMKQKPINPMKILKEQCYCRFALKVESIFIGQLAISIQLKLIEVVFRRKSTGSLTSLLCPNVCLIDKEEEEDDDSESNDGNSSHTTDEKEEYIYEEVEDDEVVEEEVEVIKPVIEEVQKVSEIKTEPNTKKRGKKVKA